MKFSKYWTTVTPFSITLAVILFITLPIIGFLIGHSYQQNPLPNTPVSNVTPTQSPSPTVPISNAPTQVSYCNPQDLQAQITSEGAAGTIYLNLTITNNSSSTCQIIGNNYVDIKFNPTVQNISIKDLDQPTEDKFTLNPGQTIYSQASYQNGAECSGPSEQKTPTLSYKISPTNIINFIVSSGSSLEVPICSSLSDIVQFQVWPLTDIKPG